MLLVNAKLMNDIWDQRMTLLIEASVSIYLYALLSLTDFMEVNTLRVELGSALALLTGMIVGINVIIFLWKICCRGFSFIKLAVSWFYG
jgi:hypothetical protein